MSTSNGFIAVRWHDKESMPWVDVIPVSAIAVGGVTRRFEHLMSGPKGAQAKAFCRLSVGGSRALFDYRAFDRLNNESGCYLGVMRFVFENGARRDLISIDWKPDGERAFATDVASAIGYALPPQPIYKRNSDRPRKRLAKVQARDGQGEFRNEMLKVYGGRCCISDCPVLDVLEGAHIDVFAEGVSHSPQNGLLLRCDLHALYDSDLLGIEPNTKIVHIAESARTGGYERLHRRVIVRDPMGGKSYLPSGEALARRWKKYLDKDRAH